MATTSYAERVRARQTAETEMRDQHQAELAQLDRDWEARKADLLERHKRALTELRAPFEAEQQQIERAFFDHVFTTLPPLVSAFLESETRAAAVAIGDAWRAIQARRRHDFGWEFGVRQLSYFIADWVIEQHPGAAAVFGYEPSWHPEGLAGTRGIPIDERAVHQALESGDGAALREALLKLSATLERVGKTRQSPYGAISAERWHAMRQGSGELLSRDEAGRIREQASIERVTANAALRDRARHGEHIEGKSEAWHKNARESAATLR